MEKPINIRLISKTNKDPEKLTSFAFNQCYKDESPKFGEVVDLDEKLFNTGHHTTFSHYNLNFQIDDISMADITFGLHLVHPFYNSDQRSGSFCHKMYLEADFDKIETYIKSFWALTKEEIIEVMDYIKSSYEIYQLNYDKAQNIAKALIKTERPYAGEEYIQEKSKKVAQEQLRMFIPSIFPTGLLYSINLLSLASLYESAWNPVMDYTTSKMAELVLKDYPNLKFLFKEERKIKNSWYPKMKNKDKGDVIFDVDMKLMNYDLKFLKNNDSFVVPSEEMMYPIDKLNYLPELMNNNLKDLVTKVNVPVAVMGQDQRHRLIRRGRPVFTGDFYLSVIPKALGLSMDAKNVLVRWRRIYKKMDRNLATVLAPLGAMLEYTKKGSLNSICHEQAGRLCWHNSRDIYELSRLFRSQIKEKLGDNDLVNLFEPPCYRKGKCWRGSLYCGRDLMNRKEEQYFEKRLV